MEKSIIERVIKMQSNIHEVEVCLENLYWNLKGEKYDLFTKRLERTFPDFRLKTKNCEFAVYACLGIRLSKINGKKEYERFSSSNKLELIAQVPDEDIIALLEAILYCIRG